MKLITLMATVLLLYSCSAYPSTFMPENDLDKYDSLFGGNITEDQFNKAIDQVESVYQPIIANLGGNLVIDRNWNDPTVNAYANREYGNVWKVAMFGGLARRSEINYDGFIMVICHEVGHHIAGFPFVQDWASSEGQSDYFAANVCAPKIWEDGGLGDEVYLPSTARGYCNRNYTEDFDRKVCYRTMAASKSISDLLGALNSERPVSFDTPSLVVVKKTMTSHPPAQCRLDTYMAGSVCSVGWADGVVPKNKRENDFYNCTMGEAARPRCWYAP